MRLSLISAGALTVFLLPAAFTRAADAPREDPLKEYELARSATCSIPGAISPRPSA